MDVPRRSPTRAAAPRARALTFSALCAFLLLTLPVRLAGADAAADKATAEELLATIAAPGPAEPRLAAAAKLYELAPRLVPVLSAALTRARTSSVDDRRAVLLAIDAAVPDASGKFSQPQRQKTSEIKADDKIDWLAALVRLDPSTPVPAGSQKGEKDKKDKKPKQDDEAAEEAPPPATLSPAALADVVTDVALIRALAASRDHAAAGPIFDAAFADDTMLYRDECGRTLRKMEPLSIPELTLESQKEGDRRRYATYQLERLDRQDPAKALSAATSDEALLIAILDAFRVSKHREAVYAVFDYIDQDSPRVREAARKAWLGYVTGKPPKDAPKRKMVLPGGKLAEKETPMWLTYRELATEKLRKASEELLGEPIADEAKVDTEAVSRRVFAHYDAIRDKREAEQWSQARGLAASGDVAGAVARLDQMLAVNPDRKERAEMAAIYLTHGKNLQQADQWAEAATAFSTALGLSPESPLAKDASAGRDFALGKAMEADGKDGTGLFRRAAGAKPDFEEAAAAAEEGERPRWMLYAASFAGLMAVALAAFAVARRRRLA
jgi:tetratricopeptide (TPR) repeat protein